MSLFDALVALFRHDPVNSMPAATTGPAKLVDDTPVVSPVASALVPRVAIELVKLSEGFEANVYPDPESMGAPYTCGYGSTLNAAGKPFMMGDPPLTEPAAAALLARDMVKAAVAVDRLVHIALPEPCRAALISFVYNLGEGTLARSTLLKLINGDQLDAAANEFPKWNMASGHVSNGLVVRRARERSLFLTGL